MAEQATERTTIAAPPERCYEIAADVERYPEWARDVKAARILSHDADGRPLEVEFRTAAMGRSTTYVLRYDHTGAPGRLAWVLQRGDLTRILDGVYDFAPADGDPGSTAVTYQLEVDLVVPLPGFVKRRAEGKILRTALPELKARVEALGAV